MERKYFLTSLFVIFLLILSTPAAAAPITFSASGASPAVIQPQSIISELLWGS
jgi:hypothetical protein